MADVDQLRLYVEVELFHLDAGKLHADDHVLAGGARGCLPAHTQEHVAAVDRLLVDDVVAASTTAQKVLFST